MQDFLVSASKKVGYLLAGCIILAAAFVSLSHLLSPVLAKHKTKIETLASDYLQMPVQVGSVELSWYRYQPEIILNSVTLLNKDTHLPILQVQKVGVFFSLLQSLWRLQPVESGIMISGSEISAHQSSNGEVIVQGFPNLQTKSTQPYQQETKFNDIMGWLSSQPRLMLRNIDVRYTPYQGQKYFLTLYDLTFQNKTDRHVIFGKAILHQDVPTEVTLALRWRGSDVDLSKIKARAYIYLSGLSLAQWFNTLTWQDWQITKGIVSTKIWASWDQGKLQRLQTLLQGYNLKVQSKDKKDSHQINRLSGNFGWVRTPKGVVFAGNDVLIDFPAHLWPVSNFYAALDSLPDGKIKPVNFQASYIDLHDIQPYLLSLQSFLPSSVKQVLINQNVSGNLQNVAVNFAPGPSDWSIASFSTAFNGISFLPGKNYPGVSNLSGAVKWSGTEGNVTLNSSRSLVTYEKFFNKKLSILQITGDIQLKQEGTDNWLISSPLIHLFNNDAAANVSGSLKLAPNVSPVIDLNANFTLQNVAHVGRYLPLQVFNDQLKYWLQNAFLLGEIKHATAMVKGNLDEFPFDNKKGKFFISALVNNLQLHYADGWPDAQRINGTISFDGRQMRGLINNAEILGIPLKNVVGVIPQIGGEKIAVLEINSDAIDSDFQRMLTFIQQSPLQNKIGKVFSYLTLEGPLTLKLNLLIPLSKPYETKVFGNTHFPNALLILKAWNLRIEELQGDLQFTENSITAENIQGVLFNKPLNLSLATLHSADNSNIIQAVLKNNLQIADLENWLKIPFSKSVQGAADVETKINIAFDKPLEIELASNLKGIQVNLGGEFSKSAEIEKEFLANLFIQENEPLRIRLHYGKTLGAALIFNKVNNEFKLSSANLRLGSGIAEWPQSSGLFITGEFDILDWEMIQNYINQSGTGMTELKLQDINITAKKLHLLSQEVTDVRLLVKPVESGWNIDINSKDVIGFLQVPAKFSREGLINAQFQKLHLHTASDTEPKPTTVDVKNLPGINLLAKNVEFAGNFIGRVIFRTSPSNNGMRIRTLSIISPYMNLQSNGDWTNKGTHLVGRMTTQRLSDLINSFGLQAHNFIATKGDLDFNLSWSAAPFAPALASLNGRAKLDIGSGRIVDIGAATESKMSIGRMLSIFSLEWFPRLLSGGFNDMFQKGYAFDFIKGDFAILNGDAHTSNLLFKGPVADVGINGKIGFNKKNYDFILSVTPHVTSSIPIAATLLTGQPLIGLAALAVNAVISSKVSKVSTYTYAVRGTWSNPTWTPLNSGKKSGR